MAGFVKNLWKFLNQPDPSDEERVERWTKEIEEADRIKEEKKRPFLKSKQKIK
jgi:hypothetical protein